MRGMDESISYGGEDDATALEMFSGLAWHIVDEVRVLDVDVDLQIADASCDLSSSGARALA